MPVLYCFCFVCSFCEVCSEAKEADSSSCVCLCQDCFGYSGSFVFPYKLKTFFSSSVGNAIGNLIGGALNLYIALGHTVTL